MPTINDLLKSLLARAKAGDFGIAFAIELLQLGALVLQLFDGDEDAKVYGAGGGDLETAMLLYSEATGSYMAMPGPLSRAILAMVIRAVIARVLQELPGSDLPDAVKELVKKCLEALQELL